MMERREACYEVLWVCEGGREVSWTRRGIFDGVLRRRCGSVEARPQRNEKSIEYI
jgi:hypothetical protein